MWTVSHAEGIIKETIKKIELELPPEKAEIICRDLEYVKRLIHRMGDEEYCYGEKL